MVSRAYRQSHSRGFTLVELMVVVAIIAVLSTVAVYGLRKYVLAAKTAEPIEMINNIRAAQEAYKDETFQYLHVSSMSSYFPFSSATELGSNKKKDWSAGASSEFAQWKILGVMPSAVVQFGYACAAGNKTGVPDSTALGLKEGSFGATSAPGPWYVVRAAGDRDGDGDMAIFIGSSFSDAILSEADTE